MESVQEFPYLGSDIDSRIAKASRAFGALTKAGFLDKNLKLKTKRNVYQACVLLVLFYGSECWTLLKRHKIASIIGVLELYWESVIMSSGQNISQ